MGIRRARLTLTKPGVSMLFNEKGLKIILHDRDSSIDFAEIRLTPEQVCQAFSRLVQTDCSIELRGIDRVGKIMEWKTHKFEIPEELRYGVYKDDEKDKLIQLCDKTCPKGWEPDYYFGSQNTFSTDSGKYYAQTTIRRWV